VRTKAVGIVVPVHNEERLLEPALAAIDEAVSLVPSGVACLTALVLNGCTDDSASIARRWARDLEQRQGRHRSSVLRCRSAGVGSARRAGCSLVLRKWRHLDPGGMWLATTDADSRVPPSWLTTQLEAHERGFDLWSGRVAVEDWSLYHEETATRWNEVYAAESAPIHGANLGFNAQAYRSVGGFRLLLTGEDRALYDAIVASGAPACRDDTVRVLTSSRRHARAPAGFAHALTTFDDDVRGTELTA
jgi:glycosyltransferase involved in cell wall biosynthesis